MSNATTMKSFYIIFFVGFIVLSGLLYLSTWWFLGGAGIIIFFTTYHFYNTKLKSFGATIDELESNMEELQQQLDRSLLKEEKATKEVRLIGAMKQELLTALNHEIRTPMNGVLGTTVLLADTKLTNEQKEYVETIKDSGYSLLATLNGMLVNNILDSSKLERKDKKLQCIDFNLRDTVEEVVDLFATNASNKRVELLNDIDENVPSQLSGDNKRLREVLMNLIENAVKFTHSGQVLIQVQSLNAEGKQPILSFAIEDSGIGISVEQMKQLFYELPRRGFDREKMKSGRGLVVCKKYAELMGGEIEVKSKLGSGSIFTFTVPFEYGQLSPGCTNVQSTNSEKFEDKHILVADDNTTGRNILIRQLKALKINTTAADSARQVLEILASNKNFDLILIDLTLPGMDGLQLARAVKKSYPDLRLLLLNPAGDEAYKQEQELFSAILTKPVRQHVFRDHIVSLIAQPGAEKNNNPQEIDVGFSKKNPLQLLIAEDNIVNQKIAVKILANLGYQPRLANNGKEALEMYLGCDLVLMDIQMPEMDGLEATKMIRSRPGSQPVIIAMTANVLQGDRNACIQSGMDDYISKPIILPELLQQLEKWSALINEREKGGNNILPQR